jgi:phage shock protein A
MGLMKRVSLVFKAKASKALDRVEDPRETLDYSYERQLEMLQKVKRSLADVATSRKRLEMQGTELQRKATKLHEQAKRAMAAGREDLAREALARRATIEPELEGLKAQHAQLQAEETKLTEASRRLSTQVAAFRTRKETIKATYTAAEAQSKINEALSGISEEMGDVGLAVQRAEDRTIAMQSRAGAIDELLASGALDDLSKSNDRLELDLHQAVAQAEIEAELTRLRGELPPGQAADSSGTPRAPRPLESGES